MNWFDALQCCYYQQGYLAEPQNQAEQDTINSYLTICEWQISSLDWIYLNMTQSFNTSCQLSAATGRTPGGWEPRTCIMRADG